LRSAGGTRGRLKTARPVGVLGRPFFSNSCVASLSKQLFYVIISGAPFSSIFNHLRYSLNTSHKAFRHVTTAREMRRPACEVLSSLDALRLPSPVPEECHSRSTNRTVHSSIATDIGVLRQYAYPQTNFLYSLSLLRYSCYSEPTSR
jgi:hypothetical protein